MISSAQQTPTGVRTFGTWSPVSYDGLRTRVTTLESLAAYNPIDAELAGRGEPLQVPALQVSPISSPRWASVPHAPRVPSPAPQR